MNKWLIIISMILLVGCTGKSIRPIDISNETDLTPFIGKYVQVRGVVTNTKCPLINEIEMWELDDYREKLVEAEGILYSWVVTEEMVKKMNFANRGAGQFFKLKNMKFKEIKKDSAH